MTPTTGIIDDSTLSISLYGLPKIGKTLWACDWPETLLLSWDGNFAHLKGVFAIDVRTWEEFGEALRLYQNSSYKWLVIDTSDLAWIACQNYIRKRLHITHESDADWGKGFDLLKGEWLRTITGIRGMKRGVIWISHAIQQKTKEKGVFWTSTLSDSPRIKLHGSVDCIGFARMSEKGERIVSFRSSPQYEAGDYTGRLPDSLPLNRAAFHEVFKT